MCSVPMTHQPQQRQQQQQQWSPDQRRQQIAELLRNKGVICRDYLYTGRCPRSPACPYMHVANGETRPVPWSVCTFFGQGKCLRDRCTFFHGTLAQLEELHATGSPVYRPQDYMKIVAPPAEYLNPDGSIATSLPFAPMAQPPSVQVMRGPAMAHENAVNTFQPVLVVQRSPQAITSTMFSRQGNTPNTSTSQFPFYTNTPVSAQLSVQGPGQPTTVFPQRIHSVQPTTFYQTTPAMPSSQAQQYPGTQSYNNPQQALNAHQPPQQQQHQVFFHIQQQ